MIEELRRAFNQIDALFDRRAMTQEMRFSQSAGDSNQPVTARHAFQEIHRIARKMERQARLKLIVSQHGLFPDGTSAHWEFFFDLPKRRARLMVDWVLPWDEADDDYAPARIDVIAKPFLAENGLLHKMVKEGKLLNRQVIGLWEQELRRTSYLPTKFRDTDAAIADFQKQGLDVTMVEFSVTTGKAPEGFPAWIAQTRREAYYAAFRK